MGQGNFLEDDGAGIPDVEGRRRDTVAVAHLEDECLDVLRGIHAGDREFFHVGDVVVDKYGVGFPGGSLYFRGLAGLPGDIDRGDVEVQARFDDELGGDGEFPEAPARKASSWLVCI